MNNFSIVLFLFSLLIFEINMKPLNNKKSDIIFPEDNINKNNYNNNESIENIFQNHFKKNKTASINNQNQLLNTNLQHLQNNLQQQISHKHPTGLQQHQHHDINKGQHHQVQQQVQQLEQQQKNKQQQQQQQQQNQLINKKPNYEGTQQQNPLQDQNKWSTPKPINDNEIEGTTIVDDRILLAVPKNCEKVDHTGKCRNQG